MCGRGYALPEDSGFRGGYAPTVLIIAHHSHRNATIGSTFVARRAGIQQASSATSASSKATPTNVNGSVGLTPNNKLVIKRVKANDAARPRAMPSSVSLIPGPMTDLKTSVGLAPSAI